MLYDQKFFSSTQRTPRETDTSPLLKKTTITNEIIVRAISSGLLAELAIILCQNLSAVEDKKKLLDGNEISSIFNRIPGEIKDSIKRNEMQVLVNNLNNYADTIIETTIPTANQSINKKTNKKTSITCVKFFPRGWAIFAASVLCVTIGYMEFQSAKDTAPEKIWKYLLAMLLILLALPAGAPLSYANNEKLIKKIVATPLAEGQYNFKKAKWEIIGSLLISAIFGVHGLATALVNSGNTRAAWQTILPIFTKYKGLQILANMLGLLPPGLSNAVFTYGMFAKSAENDLYAVSGGGKVWRDANETPIKLAKDLNALRFTSGSDSRIREKILQGLKDHFARIEASNNFAVSKQAAQTTLDMVNNNTSSMASLLTFNFQDAKTENFKSLRYAAFWLSSVPLGGFIAALASEYVKELASNACKQILINFGIENEQAAEVSEVAGKVALVCTAFMTMLALKTSFFQQIFRQGGLQEMLKPKASWGLNIPALGLAATTIAMTFKSENGDNLEWLSVRLATSILAQTVLSRLGIDMVLADYKLKQVDPRDQLNQEASDLYEFFTKLDTPILICFQAIFQATKCALTNSEVSQEKVNNEFAAALETITQWSNENQQKSEVRVCIN